MKTDKEWRVLWACVYIPPFFYIYARVIKLRRFICLLRLLLLQLWLNAVLSAATDVDNIFVMMASLYSPVDLLRLRVYAAVLMLVFVSQFEWNVGWERFLFSLTSTVHRRLFKAEYRRRFQFSALDNRCRCCCWWYWCWCCRRRSCSRRRRRRWFFLVFHPINWIAFIYFHSNVHARIA